MQPMLPAHMSTRRHKRPSRIKRAFNIRESRSQTYWWVVARMGEREILLGSFPDQITANNEGYNTGSYFDVYEFPTRDRARAAQMYKARKLEITRDLEGSMERLGHSAPKGHSAQGTVSPAEGVRQNE